MTGSISAPTTICYSTLSGTASAAAGDFTAVTNHALTFNPGGPTTQQISIPILIEPGNPVETAETFSVGLRSATGKPATPSYAAIAASHLLDPHPPPTTAIPITTCHRQ